MLINPPAVVVMAIIAILSPNIGPQADPPILPSLPEGKTTNELMSSPNMVTVGSRLDASQQVGREKDLGKWMYSIYKILNSDRLIKIPQNFTQY